MLTVSTFLWRDDCRKRSYTFTPEHVIILKNMVERNISIPFEFVCVAGRASDNREENQRWFAEIAAPLAEHNIRVVPLNFDKHVPGTCFTRLMLRHPHISGYLGSYILNLDLDCVIVSDITPLVSYCRDDHMGTRVSLRSYPSVFWRNPNYEEGGRRAFYQTSIQYINTTASEDYHTELWKDFDPNFTPTWVNRRFGGAEQAWVSERLSWGLPYWDSSDGVYGAGRMFKDNQDKGIGGDLPENARIVFFPGDRMPEQPEMKERFGWIEDHYK